VIGHKQDGPVVYEFTIDRNANSEEATNIAVIPIWEVSSEAGAKAQERSLDRHKRDREGEEAN